MANDYQYDVESKGDNSNRSQQINNASSELSTSVWSSMRDDNSRQAGSDLQNKQPARLTLQDGVGSNDNQSFNLRTKEQAPSANSDVLSQIDFYDSQAK